MTDTGGLMEKVRLEKKNIFLPDYIIDTLSNIKYIEHDKESITFYPNDIVVVFYGTRGSTSYSGREYMKYGSNTTSYQIFSPKLPVNQLYIGDGGSGVLEVSQMVINKCFAGGINPFADTKPKVAGMLKRVVNLYSHYHYDHLHMGSTLAGIFHANPVEKLIVGHDNPKLHFKNTFKHPIFPRDFSEIESAYKFFPIEDIRSTVLILLPNGDVKYIGVSMFDELITQEEPVIEDKKDSYKLDECLVVRCYPARHPDECVSYRYENYDKNGTLNTSFVFLTDHEIMDIDAKEQYFVKQVVDSDCLYIDGQYVEKDYKAGFGHGRVEVILDVAKALKVKNLLIGHHDPGRKDAELDKIIREANAKFKKKFKEEEAKDYTLIGAMDKMMLFIPDKQREHKDIIVSWMQYDIEETKMINNPFSKGIEQPENKHIVKKVLLGILIGIVSLIVLSFFLAYIIPLKKNVTGVAREDFISKSGQFLVIDPSEYEPEKVKKQYLDTDFINENDEEEEKEVERKTILNPKRKKRPTEIYVEDKGDKNADDVIILIHGLAGSTYSWREVVPRFVKEGYRVITMDLKGFGLSDKGYSSNHSHIEQAKLIAGVLDKLNINSVHIAGHSMGVNVVLHFVYRYQYKVKSLILIDGGTFTQKGTPGLMLFLNFPPIRRIARHISSWTVTKSYFKKLMLSAYYNKDVATDEVITEYYNRFLIDGGDLSYFAMMRDSNRNSIDFCLCKIKKPSLIIWGDNEPWIGEEKLEYLNNNLNEPELKIIDDSGHLPMEEQPKRFSDAVIEFVNNN